jgi:hypothetical protein
MRKPTPETTSIMKTDRAVDEDLGADLEAARPRATSQRVEECERFVGALAQQAGERRSPSRQNDTSTDPGPRGYRSANGA